MLNRLIDYINEGQYFTYTKFGDGEIICMEKKFPIGQTNCDYQIYSNELGDKLIESLVYFSDMPFVYIGEWDFDLYQDVFNKILDEHNVNLKYTSYKLLLHIIGADIQTLKKFYFTIKNKPVRKVYVCPEKLNDVKSFLDCDVINVPEKNAYSEYDIIKEKLLSSEYDIYMYSAGLLSKVLIKDIMQKHPNKTHIDIGSGLDNLFIGETRDKQIEKETLRAIYES